MYLYFNKQGELTTKIPHGEQVRQGNVLNLYVCFPLDFSVDYSMDDWSIFVEFTKADGRSNGVQYPLENKGIQTFNKLKSSEMTYDLVHGDTYHTFFVSVVGETNLPGNLEVNISLEKDGILFYQETTTLFVEKTLGLNNVDITIDKDQFEILREEQRKVNVNYNELKNTKVSIVETTDDIVYGKGNQGKEITIPYTLGDGTPYTIVLRDDKGKIGGIGEPTKETHAANKKYVDEKIKNSEEFIDEKIGLVFVDGVLTETEILELWTNKPDGRYNITSETYGPEILILYHDNKLFKRMTGEADYTYDFKKAEWKLASGAGGSMNEIPGVLSEDEIVALWNAHEQGEYPDGFYTITSQMYGKEMIVMTRQIVMEGETDDFGNPKDERLFKRITGQFDYTYNFNLEQWEVSSGGTGSGGNLVLIPRNPDQTVAAGRIGNTDNPVTINFYFRPVSGKSGTANIKKGGRLVKSEKLVGAGEKSIIVSEKDILSVGNNELSLTVVDDGSGLDRTMPFKITVIDLKLENVFNDDRVYDTTFTFYYKPIGAITKTVQLFLDNIDTPIFEQELKSYETNTTIETNIDGSNLGITHGVHKLKLIMLGKINETDENYIYSNELNYNLIYTVAGDNTVLISSKFNKTKAKQGESLIFDYFVYDPNTNTPSISLLINDIEKYTRITDGTRKSFDITDYPYSENEEKIKFTLQSGGTKLDFYVLVEKSGDWFPVANSILNLTSFERSNDDIENRQKWFSNNVDIEAKFIDFNWSTNGWIKPEGDTLSCLRLNGRAKVNIPFKIFSSANFDINNGSTIEIEFKAIDVETMDKVLMQCIQKTIDAETQEEKIKNGFIITANYATFYTGLFETTVNFKENEKTKLSFVIEPNKEGSSKLIKIFINGIVSGIVQYTKENFRHDIPEAQIEINPYGGSIDIYSIRVYKFNLNDSQVVWNYMLDMPIDNRIISYNRNNIVKEDNSIDYDKIKKIIPILTIDGPLPLDKGDEKNVHITYEVPNTETITDIKIDEDAIIDIQGTSSVTYPRKNYKIKFKNTFSFYDGAIPEKTYTMKADYMESSHSHNTGNAIIMNKWSPKTLEQAKNENIRNSIFGFPIVIFNRTNDGDLVYLGVYNFNNDKGNADTIGLKDGCESWEFADNAKDLCNFNADWDSLPLSEIPASFEARYPKDSTNYTKLKEVVKWVYSTKFYEATGDELFEPVEYKILEKDENGVDVEQTYTYTHDTIDYRKHKFKCEFDKYFNKEFALFYYVMMDVVLGVDSRAKNMFLDYLEFPVDYSLENNDWEKQYDCSHIKSDNLKLSEIGNETVYRWCPRWYDMDTTYGLDNIGRKMYKYFYEQKDYVYGDGTVVMENDGRNEPSSAVYAGINSVLWNNFQEIFMDDIQNYYYDLRSNKELSYENMLQILKNDFIDKISETMYNTDSEFKYVYPYTNPEKEPDASHFYVAQGSRLSHLQWWLKNRFSYLDSRYKTASYNDDRLEMRVGGVANPGITPNYNYTVTPYINSYCGVRFGNKGYNYKRTIADEPVVIEAVDFTPTTIQEIYVFNASNLLSIGNLYDKYISGLKVESATRLTELIIGNGSSSYQNNNLDSLEIGTLPMLKKLDIRNCPKLTRDVDVSQCLNIKEIYATGTNIPSITLAKGGNLEKLYLPDSIKTLTLQNQPFLDDIQINKYNNLEKIIIDNVPQINSKRFLLRAKNLKYIRFVNVNWTGEDSLDETNYADIMDYLFSGKLGGLNDDGSEITIKDENNNDIPKLKPFISGQINIKGITKDIIIEERQLKAWNDFFAEYGLTVTADKTEYGHEVKFYNGDGTVLQTKYVLNGQDVKYTGPEPTKADDGEIKYTFIGWDKELDNIQSDLDVRPKFLDNKPSKLTLLLDDMSYLKPTIRISNFSGTAEIDWDDGNKEELTINTMSYKEINHIYDTTGKYEIKILLKGKKYSSQYYYDLSEKNSSSYHSRCDISFYNNGDGNKRYYSSKLIECELQEHIFDRLHPMLLIESQIKQLVVPYSIEFIGGDSYVYTGLDSQMSYTCQIFYKSSIEDLIILNPNTKFGYNYSGFLYCKNLKCITNSLDNIDNKIHLPNKTKYITSYMFESCRSINEIIMPESVELIEYNAFAYCTSLQNITIPKNVLEIGSACFRNCSSLKNISFNENITKIGSNCFTGCSNLDNVVIPNYVLEIGSACFSQCDSLKEIVLSTSLKQLNYYTFAYCTSLEEIDIPDGVIALGDTVFADCEKLTSINVSDTVEKIGKECFRNCSDLTNFVLPSNLKELGISIFTGCTKLEEIYYNNTLENWCKVIIGSSIFKNEHIFKLKNGDDVYYEPKEIEIPNTINNIGNYQFANMKITSCNLNKNIKKIGDYAFSRCTDLVSISNTQDVEELGIESFYQSKITSFTCSENLKVIPKGCFDECTSLNDIELPDSIEYIGDYAFRYTQIENLNITENLNFLGKGAFEQTKIKTVTIPSTIIEISPRCFYSCKMLNNVVFSNKLILIGQNAFESCSNLLEINLPATLEKIETYGLNCGATGKTNITFNGKKPPVIESLSLPANSHIQNIYVPAGYKKVYQDEPSLNSYLAKIVNKGIGFGDVEMSWTLSEATDKILVPYGNDSGEIPQFAASSSNTDILKVVGVETTDEKPDFVEISIQTSELPDDETITETITITITLTMTVKGQDFEKEIVLGVYDSDELPKNIYTVENISTLYQFTQKIDDENKIYYESSNQYKSNSYSLCKVNIASYGDQNMFIDCRSYGEGPHDYGILSELDKVLSNNNTVDVINVKKTFINESSNEFKTVEYGQIDKGNHFIYIKYRKDGSGDQGDDTLRFKVRFEKVTA